MILLLSALALAAPADVRVAAAFDGEMWLKTLVDPASVPTPPLVPDEDRSVWVGDLPLRALGEDRIGRRWKVTDVDGTASCRIAGFAVLVRGEGGFDEDGRGPSCGSPEVWARLDCDRAFDVGFATPPRAAPPLLYTGSPPERDESALSVVRRQPEYAALRDQGLAYAKAYGEVVAPTSVQERFEVTTWTGGGRTFRVVEAGLYTGDGSDGCGDPDWSGQMVGMIDEAGDVVVPFRALDLWAGPWFGNVSGVVDTDRDGVPEIWTTPVGYDGTQRLLGTTERPETTLSHPWCGCGC